jgi:hypothetical protein
MLRKVDTCDDSSSDKGRECRQAEPTLFVIGECLAFVWVFSLVGAP